jgi:hypothetical protein
MNDMKDDNEIVKGHCMPSPDDEKGDKFRKRDEESQ